MSFDNLGLDPRLMKAVGSMGYTVPTPIQTEAIPLVLAGRDVVGIAQTGTGKTAAFVLPLMQNIPAKPGGIRALVVTPTRELAVQIEGVARDVARHTRHRVAVVYGGVGYEPQKQALKRGVDVLVACPGRLLDLISQGDCNLGSVEVLVLDEADRMLDMGFWPDVKRIIAKVPPTRQNLLFSATMSPEVMKIIQATLDNPARVEVSPATTPVEAIVQSIYPVGGKDKADLLLSIVKEHGLKKVLVFTRTKHRADRVARVLDKAGVRGAAIHGNRSQAQRQKALESFRKGHVHVLVATDVVSRGIDIDDITHVVNFDLPNVPADYVHRIGRTARAGRSGAAISLYSPEEHEQLRDIEKTIGSTLPCEDHPGFAYRDARVVPDPERSAASPNKQGGSKQGAGSGGGKPKRNRRGGGRSGSSRAGATGSGTLDTVASIGAKSSGSHHSGANRSRSTGAGSTAASSGGTSSGNTVTAGNTNGSGAEPRQRTRRRRRPPTE
ncbi:MAG: DEAD/DEAH box helicase [Coriobacteriia bacterium]|nr:DEAD/DEAH box helicase [Coriobacteriia bacterium]